ncbi:MAG: DUF6655 family protein [Pirellulaceae bacterium]
MTQKFNLTSLLPFALSLIGAVFTLISTGCTTARTSNTSRTGIEQLLLSNAIDQSLDRLALPPVNGKKVFVDTQYLDSVDKGYLIGSLRQRLLSDGALLTDAKDGSDITMEVCSGGVGTDDVDSYLGMPGIALPGPMPVQLPEVRLFQKKSQFGTAKISIVAYTTTDGQLLYNGGTALARSDDSSWSVMGVGPFQTGSVRDEVRTAGSANGSSYTTRYAQRDEQGGTVNR